MGLAPIGHGTQRTGHPHPGRGRSVPMAAPRKRFSILWFSLRMIAQFGLLLLGIRTFLPRVWSGQLAAGPLAFVLVLFGMHLLMCFFEWAFHRYVLHAV